MADTKISALTALTLPDSNDVLPIVDTSTVATKGITAANLGAGWIGDAGTWSYSSADAPTFVASVNADMSGVLSAGMRVRLTQTTAKYFIVTAVGAFGGGVTLVTLYGGTDYVLANAAVTLPAYSAMKAPFGFPLNPAKWAVKLSTNFDTIATNNVRTNFLIGAASLYVDIPIGAWNVTYYQNLQAAALKAAGGLSDLAVNIAFSTIINNYSDDDLLFQYGFYNSPHGGNSDLIDGVYRTIVVNLQKSLTQAAKTRWYPVGRVQSSSPDSVELSDNNYVSYGLIINVACAYL